jgi:hypothetical protein
MATYTYSFSANTRIKSAEVNTNFNDVWPTNWTTVTAPVFNVTSYDNGAGGQPTTTVSRYCQIGDTAFVYYKGSGVKAGAFTYLISITSHSFPAPV